MATWLLQIKRDYDKEKLIKTFLDKFKISPYELTLLESTPDLPIRIEDVRAVLKKIHLKPRIGKKSALLILGADKVSLAVANTFLKTLEEPPSYLEICLAVQNPRRLPKTVLSRSQPLNLNQESFHFLEKTGEISFFALQNLTINELFALAEKISKNKEAALYLTGWLEEIKKETIDKNSPTANLRIFRLLVSDLKLIENSNLNQRLLLENLFLKLKNNF